MLALPRAASRARSRRPPPARRRTGSSTTDPVPAARSSTRSPGHASRASATARRQTRVWPARARRWSGRSARPRRRTSRRPRAAPCPGRRGSGGEYATVAPASRSRSDGSTPGESALVPWALAPSRGPPPRSAAWQHRLRVAARRSMSRESSPRRVGPSVLATPTGPYPGGGRHAGPRSNDRAETWNLDIGPPTRTSTRVHHPSDPRDDRPSAVPESLRATSARSATEPLPCEASLSYLLDHHLPAPDRSTSTGRQGDPGVPRGDRRAAVPPAGRGGRRTVRSATYAQVS